MASELAETIFGNLYFGEGTGVNTWLSDKNKATIGQVTLKQVEEAVKDIVGFPKVTSAMAIDVEDIHNEVGWQDTLDEFRQNCADGKYEV